MKSSLRVALSIVCLAALIPGCKQKNSGEPEREPTKDPTSNTEGDGPASADGKLGAPNNPPTLELPAYEWVGVGQEIGFGIEVIDQESDEFVVELIAKPASASFDPVTLTVTWTPTKSDLPLGAFVARITEKHEGGAVRVYDHPFSIGVTKNKQEMPRAQPLGAAVETLITIHDPARLAEANKQWPIDVLLEKAAQSSLSDMDEAAKKANKVADRKALYESFLHSLALGQNNPTVDPASPKFDAKLWGNPKDWKIIALRPRLDKKWHELRIVYKAKSHAATYAMFKFRPFADEDIPKDTGLALNNKAMADLTLEAFFTDDGTLDPTLFRDKRAHGVRAAKYMTSIVSYEAPDKPWHSATFLGLPMEARLGGGSKRDAGGTYASGDAWGWHVMKAKPKDGVVVFNNIPIKGFTTAVKPAADNKSWEMACGPAFGKGKPAASLCRETGHVDMPATGDGMKPVELSEIAKLGDKKLVSSLVDAANIHHDYKATMEEEIDLHDGRRDLFEEKGMTCSQCHVRNFGVRDMYDAAITDPSAGTPKALNKKQNTSYFVLTPTERWQPYMIDFQHKQECKIKVAIESATGKKTSLSCPLRAGR